MAKKTKAELVKEYIELAKKIAPLMIVQELKNEIADMKNGLE